MKKNCDTMEKKKKSYDAMEMCYLHDNQRI